MDNMYVIQEISASTGLHRILIKLCTCTYMKVHIKCRVLYWQQLRKDVALSKTNYSCSPNSFWTPTGRCALVHSAAYWKVTISSTTQQPQRWNSNFSFRIKWVCGHDDKLSGAVMPYLAVWASTNNMKVERFKQNKKECLNIISFMKYKKFPYGNHNFWWKNYMYTLKYFQTKNTVTTKLLISICTVK